MASIILPERFDKGDFAIWLRQYECCAVANGHGRGGGGSPIVKVPADVPPTRSSSLTKGILFDNFSRV